MEVEIFCLLLMIVLHTMDVYKQFTLIVIYLHFYHMEILGIDPKLMICKITVLPVKLYPPLYIFRCSMSYIYL